MFVELFNRIQSPKCEVFLYLHIATSFLLSHNRLFDVVACEFDDYLPMLARFFPANAM